MMPLSFSRVSQIQERALRDRLQVARELISHPAEKGRSLEDEVAGVVRELLPSEYGVGTGFIAYHGASGPELSTQLDIILFDAVRTGPLGQLASCEIYPIEAVYGYIEVKASLSLEASRPNSIQRCLKQNHEIRQFRNRRYWDSSFSGSPIRTDLVICDDWLPLRGFVFAFEADGRAADAAQTAQCMADGAQEHDAHLHGVLVLDEMYLTTIPVNPKEADLDDWYNVSYTTEHSFTAFKLHLLKALGTFQRPPENWIPARETYFDLPGTWHRSKPTASGRDGE